MQFELKVDGRAVSIRVDRIGYNDPPTKNVHQQKIIAKCGQFTAQRIHTLEPKPDSTLAQRRQELVDLVWEAAEEAAFHAKEAAHLDALHADDADETIEAIKAVRK